MEKITEGEQELLDEEVERVMGFGFDYFDSDEQRRLSNLYLVTGDIKEAVQRWVASNY
jgi:hypothetical protein